MTDTAAAVSDIFAQMPGRLDPEAAAGLDAVIQFDLSGDGGGVWHCAISGRRLHRRRRRPRGADDDRCRWKRPTTSSSPPAAWTA